MIKDIKITKPIANKKIKEGFYVTVEFMYGDADGYKKETYGPFTQKEKQYLINFLNMLEKCLAAYPNGRGGFDDYHSKVKELKLWDMNGDCDDDAYEKLSQEERDVIERIGFEWEYCPDGYGCQASIEDYEVKYYNSLDRVYCKVKLEKTS